MQRNRLQLGPVALLAALIVAITLPPGAQAASKYKVLHAFGKGKDGGGVFAGLALDGKGNLSGVTWSGGAYGEGTAFQLTPGSGGKWTENILHSFCRPYHCTDGYLPWDTPVLDAKGNLYDNSGPTFQLTPGPHGWGFKVIYGARGGGESGHLPPDHPGSSDLLLNAAGSLYGYFTFGKNYNGAVGELSPPALHGWKEKDLYDFCLHPRNGECWDGAYPAYRLTWDTAGNLYGVTIEGGAHKWGVAYQLEHTTMGWKGHVLYDFPIYSPGSSLTFDSSGNLYGTTFQEGPCDGTVYQLSPTGKSRWKRTIIHPFCNPIQNGGAPDEPVTFDPHTGVLYGTATAGGDPQCQCGVIFKLTPTSSGKWKYSVLYKFHGPDGAGPNGLTIDVKGNLYGTTVAGGQYKYGVAFEFTP